MFDPKQYHETCYLFRESGYINEKTCSCLFQNKTKRMLTYLRRNIPAQQAKPLFEGRTGVYMRKLRISTDNGMLSFISV